MSSVGARLIKNQTMKKGICRKMNKCLPYLRLLNETPFSSGYLLTLLLVLSLSLSGPIAQLHHIAYRPSVVGTHPDFCGKLPSRQDLMAKLATVQLSLQVSHKYPTDIPWISRLMLSLPHHFLSQPPQLPLCQPEKLPSGASEFEPTPGELPPETICWKRVEP